MRVLEPRIVPLRQYTLIPSLAPFHSGFQPYISAPLFPALHQHTLVLTYLIDFSYWGPLLSIPALRLPSDMLCPKDVPKICVVEQLAGR